MSAVCTHKLALLVIIAVLSAMTVGGVYAAETTMRDGAMHTCPFMSVPALCTMNPLAHLSESQKMFTTTIQMLVTAALLLALALALGARRLGGLVRPLRSAIFIPRYREREHDFNPLRLAFARGVIHTKVF